MARSPVKATGTGKVRETIVVDGPDPLGSRIWDGLAERTALELSGAGAPASIRVGMKGSDQTTFYGWGPGQNIPVTVPARAAFRNEGIQSQALPSTGAPVGSSTRALVAEFGL